MTTNPLLLTDFYKIGHPFQVPKGMQYAYENFTPRKSRLPGFDHMVFFGLQYCMDEYLIDAFQRGFFKRPLEEVMVEYKRVIKHTLSTDLPSYDHIANLHKLGYLPIKIKALPEGSLVPMRVPCYTMVNTHPDFAWLVGRLETLMSSVIWQPSTSATLAHAFRKSMNAHAEESGMPKEFVDWQGHDFSFRGMSSPETSMTSGMGHLLSFRGTDTIPAILGLEEYYGANIEKELVGGSVPATEHFVMCSGSKGCEIDTIRRLITEVYPSGIVSIVSDTWDLWKVLTEYLPALKQEIMAREGKLVIRPDSGDPVDIICGWPGKWPAAHKNGFNIRPPKGRGVVELLWEEFGGTVNEKGYKVLDSHIGAIYGDSISLAREKEMAERLMAKGFASQVVLGIGSYTYQYNTRDTFGTAIKATHVIIDGKPQDIFKTPITDDGTKNSATGLLRVDKVDGEFVLKEKCTPKGEQGGELLTVFENGIITKRQTLAEIRETLWPRK